MDDQKPKTNLLTSIPQTDPAELKRMADGRLSHAHYSALGQVAANWALFEATIDSSAMDISGTDAKVIVCFTAQIPGSDRKLDAYISLARLRGAEPEVIKALCKLASRAGELSRARNRAIHDPWLLDEPEAPQRFQMTAQKTAIMELHDVPTSDVLKLAGEIFALMHDFEDLTARVVWPPPTSPETSE